MSRIEKIGEALYIECIRTRRGVGLTGLSIKLLIKRESDGYYWGGSDWIVADTELDMVQFDASLFPGLYTYTGPTVTGDTYVVRSYISSGENSFTQSEIIYGREVLALDTPIENKTLEYVMKCSMANFNGDFTYDTETKILTIKDRSGAVLSTVSVPDDNTRTRIS